MKLLVFGSGSKTAKALHSLTIFGEYEVVWASSKDLGLIFRSSNDSTVVVDVLNHQDVRSLLIETSPDVVINLAAMTDVDGCESSPGLANSLNVDFPKFLAEYSREFGYYLCHISTDYVFDGNAGPYEIDAIPDMDRLSVYGKTKLLGEYPILEADGSVIRTNVLYDELGESNDFLTWMWGQFSENPRVQLKIAIDQFNNPTSTLDLAKAILRTVELRYSGILHVGGSTWLSRYELAQIAKSFWLCPLVTIVPVLSSTLNQVALRPKFGGLKIKATEDILGLKFSSISDHLLKQRHRNTNCENDYQIYVENEMYSTIAIHSISDEDGVVSKNILYPNDDVLRNLSSVINGITDEIRQNLILEYSFNASGTVSIESYMSYVTLIIEIGKSSFSCVLYGIFHENGDANHVELIMGDVYKIGNCNDVLMEVSNSIIDLKIDHHFQTSPQAQ